MTRTSAQRLTAAVDRLSYPGYRLWTCPDHLHLAAYHSDVDTGKRREMSWRRNWPGDILSAAESDHVDALYRLVAELVFAELVREHAHEIAERLHSGGRHVVDPHPGGQWAAGDGVGSAWLTVHFGTGRTR